MNTQNQIIAKDAIVEMAVPAADVAAAEPAEDPRTAFGTEVVVS